MAIADIPENQSAQDQASKPPADALKADAWQSEIKTAQKNMQKWHEQGRRINKRFLDQRSDDTEGKSKLNLFTSNVLILMATLYARFPKPLVTREFEDQDDDIARVAANIMERCLKIRKRDDFDVAMREVVQDRLVPGAGTIWFRYEPHFQQMIAPAVNDVYGNEVTPATTYDQLVHEEVIADYVYWEDLLWSPARTWSQVRWVGRAVKLTRPDAEKRFGTKIANQLKYSSGTFSNTTSAISSDGDKPDTNEVQYTVVFEIWDKRTRTAVWVSLDCPVILDKKPDPLKLNNFWPMPRPLVALTSTSNFLPRPDYLIAQDQYLELDDLNNRISILQKAIKVVGIFDGSNEEIERIFSEGIDNKIIPSRSFREFMEKGGFKGAIDWLPIDAIVGAIDKLRQYRADAVQEIYELTGISDIMRGASKASETLGAQQLKAQYGSVKLQYYQMDVASFVEEALDIKSQIIRGFFQPATILRMSNIMNSVDAEFAGSAMQLVKSPEFELRVEVHADSMAVPEFTAERDARMLFIRSLAEMLTAAAPILEKSPQAAAILLKVVQWAAASFRTGNSIETVLDKAITQIELAAKQPPAGPPPPTPKEQSEIDKNESQAGLNVAKTHEMNAKAIDTLTAPQKPATPPIL